MLGFHSPNSFSSSKEPASTQSASLQLGFLEPELNSHSESEVVVNSNSTKPASALTWHPNYELNPTYNDSPVWPALCFYQR